MSHRPSPRRPLTRRALIAAAVGASLALAGCGATASRTTGSATSGASAGGSAAAPASSAAPAEPATGLQLMVPNSPGGGYDTTARTAAKAMEAEKITGAIQVFNLPGAGGTVGLQRLVNEKGNGALAMQMGLGVVGAAYTQKSAAKLSETTPIAKLMEEAGAIVVPKDSPYTDITALVAAWKADPAKVVVGGGSSPGGPDHLFPMRLAKAVGIDPKTVNYVTFDGGGELLPAILGKKIAFGASGFGEFLDQVAAGEVRVLAVSSENRIDALKDAPTLKESGIDLVFTNWRGVVAPPGISDADAAVWVDAYTRMHDSATWKDEMAKRGWVDAFLTGDEFGAFLTAQDAEVAAVLKDLGLA